MNEILELINAINDYDVDSYESFIKLKNLICLLSDQRVENEKNSFIDSLLYYGAQKLRVFGYNHMNGFANDYLEELNVSEYEIFKKSIIEYSYTTESGMLLDHRQKDVLRTYDELENKRLLLSAPTSFGKTRLLREIIYKYKYDKIVLLFPTNALLHENYSELVRFNKQHDLGYQIINNSNIEKLERNKVIFVLTPERFLKLKNDYPSIKINFFFMDEFYKIDNYFENNEEVDEDDRDRIFRIVLYILTKETQDFYLAGPYLNLKKLGEGLLKFVNENSISLYQVDEELVYKNEIDCWNANDKFLEVDIKYLKNRKQLAANLIKKIYDENKGGTLVYCGTIMSIDSMTQLILKKINSEVIELDKRLKMFIEHLDNRYMFQDGNLRVEWAIKKALLCKVSIHHGSLPKYIQTEMLRLFNENSTKIILSTTSITEGVNTNAKNLIFLDSKKGKKELKVFDVKNIIGRAGRYYHHFVGNIYIFDEKITNKNKELESEELDFITFTDKDISNIDIDNTNVDDLVGKNINKKIERDIIIAESELPEHIMKQNRTIDWIKQIDLFKVIDSKSSDELLDFKRKISSLRTFIDRDEDSLSLIFTDLLQSNIIEKYEWKTYPAIAKTYSFKGIKGLISYEIKTKKEDKKKKNVSTILKESEYNTCYRTAFKKMNNTVEYKIPKLINLYSSIFIYVCEKREIEIDSEKFNTIINYYETGLFTKIGKMLNNLGFPSVTTKELEKKFPVEMDLEFEEFKHFLNNEIRNSNHLDSYEYDLLQDIFNTV